MSDVDPKNQPKVSFVVAARNDDYGGNFLHRMQVFVDSLLTLMNRYDFNAELVIVEWNPPEGKKSLADALTWDNLGRDDRVRIIEVSPALHSKFNNSDRIPMLEYVAKNVGIRRATGEFVLVTNADVVFNQELISYLASEPLSPDCFYRIDRYDVGAKPAPELSLDDKLHFYAENAVRVRSAMGTIPIKRFFAGNRAVYRGYLRKLFSPREAFRWLILTFMYRIHTGAPGDFTLMAKESWDKLRGYPELPTQRHVDSYFCSMAMSSGLSQVILKSPLKIFHQDHDISEMSARPMTDYEMYWNDTKKMLNLKEPIIHNAENWGLAEETLPETKIELSTHGGSTEQ